MSIDLPLILWLTESEYNGGSFNSPNLVKTLAEYSLDQVTSTNTFEGHTVWGVVLHLIYWKHQLAAALGGEVGALSFDGSDFPPLPEDKSEAAWGRTLAEMDKVHAAYIAALEAFDEQRLGDKMAWGCTYGEVIAWMATHDTYHTAMIRNMGVH